MAVDRIDCRQHGSESFDFPAACPDDCRSVAASKLEPEEAPVQLRTSSIPQKVLRRKPERTLKGASIDLHVTPRFQLDGEISPPRAHVLRQMLHERNSQSRAQSFGGPGSLSPIEMRIASYS